MTLRLEIEARPCPCEVWYMLPDDIILEPLRHQIDLLREPLNNLSVPLVQYRGSNFICSAWNEQLLNRMQLLSLDMLCLTQLVWVYLIRIGQNHGGREVVVTVEFIYARDIVGVAGTGVCCRWNPTCNRPHR